MLVPRYPLFSAALSASHDLRSASHSHPRHLSLAHQDPPLPPPFPIWHTSSDALARASQVGRPSSPSLAPLRINPSSAPCLTTTVANDDNNDEWRRRATNERHRTNDDERTTTNCSTLF